MTAFYSFLLTLFFVPIIFLLGLLLAWIPMLAWNNSLHQIFPSIPAITYWQAFWLTILVGWVAHRPSAEIKK